MGPVPVRLKSVERALVGRPPQASELRSAAAQADADLDLSEVDGSAAYRANLARVWTDRALRRATAATTRLRQ
jgi:CO/xanthine dehydrogenase FAD-binding subunit